MSEAGGRALSPRLRRLAVRGDLALTLDDIVSAPAWSSGDPAGRAELARLMGAVLVSRSWSRGIDGAVLGRAAEAVGDGALDALINLPDVVAPAATDLEAERGDAVALDRLGAAALMSAARPSRALAARLSRLFPAGLAAGVAPAQAELAQRTAEGLQRELEGAAP